MLCAQPSASSAGMGAAALGSMQQSVCLWGVLRAQVSLLLSQLSALLQTWQLLQLRLCRIQLGLQTPARRRSVSQQR